MAEHHSGGVEQAVGAVGRAVQLLGEAQVLVAGADIFVAHAGGRRQLRVLQETVHQLQQLAAGKAVFPKLQAQRVVVPDALGEHCKSICCGRLIFASTWSSSSTATNSAWVVSAGELLPIIVSGH